MNNKTKILSIITIALFGSLYFILSYFNQYASDDFYFIALVHEMGIIDGMRFCYETCGGRWSSWLLSNLVFSLYEYPISITIYHLLILVFSLISINYTLKQITELLNFKIDKFQIALLSFLFLSFLFLTTFSISESWFWITNLSTYLLNIIVFILVIGLIINKYKSILNYSLLTILMFFLSGTSEAFIFVEIALLSLLWIYFFKLNKSISLKLLFSIILLATSLIISFVAEGNNLRANTLPEPSFLKAVIVSFRGLGKISLIEIPSKIIYFIPFAIIFWTFGAFQDSHKRLIDLKKTFVYITIITISLIYISLFPSAWSLSEMPSKRAMLFADLLICGYIFYWSFILGSIIKIKSIISYISFIVIIGILIFQNYNQFKITKHYSEKLKERFEFIESQKQKTETIVLKRLPDSGMLYTAEINSYSSHYRNQHYKKYFNIEATITSETRNKDNSIIP